MSQQLLGKYMAPPNTETKTCLQSLPKGQELTNRVQAD